MSQPPDTSATPSTAATMIARDRIASPPLPSPNCFARPAALCLEREKSGPPLAEKLVHAREDFGFGAASIDDGNRAALRMTLLPLRRGESPERGRNARVEIRRCLLDAIVRAASRHPPETLLR